MKLLAQIQCQLHMQHRQQIAITAMPMVKNSLKNPETLLQSTRVARHPFLHRTENLRCATELRRPF
jgi:hypothetical protein